MKVVKSDEAYGVCLVIQAIDKLYDNKLEKAKEIIEDTLTQDEYVPINMFQLYLVLCEIANNRNHDVSKVSEVIEEMKCCEMLEDIMFDEEQCFTEDENKVLIRLNSCLSKCIHSKFVRFNSYFFACEIVSKYYRNVVKSYVCVENKEIAMQNVTIEDYK